MNRAAMFIIAAEVAACSLDESPPRTVRQEERRESAAAGSIPRAPELAPRAPIGLHGDPIPGDSARAAVVPAAEAMSTEDKLRSPQWPAMLADKQREKREATKEVMPALRAPRPSAGVVEQQRRFLDGVKRRQAELDALDPVEREQRYNELKRKELGE